MRTFLLVLLALAAGFAGAWLFNKEAAKETAAIESVYDRVMRTGTIRCGYLSSTVFLEIDVNRNQLHGIVYDYMEQLAKNLGLKVEWTEELGRGDFGPALQADRIDAYCTAMSISAERAKAADYTMPYIGNIFWLYVRQDDNRFDGNIEKINDPSVKIVAIEGDIFGKIARQHFPKATLTELVQLSPDTDPLLYVATGKADVVIATHFVGKRYDKLNPGQVRHVRTLEPFVVSPFAIPIKHGETKLKRVLDLATQEMIYNGQLDAIIDKYDESPPIFVRPHLMAN
ncbi:MAG: substrate-binding periplasmic protein [Bdellovibrionales bacterium]